MTAPEAQAVAAVQRRIAEAATRAGRDPNGVLLVGATKTVPAERIKRSGLEHVGENKVQELLEKQLALETSSITWHFIGTLQRNKVRRIAGRVSLIHGVTDAELAKEIDRRTPDGSVQQVLVELNLSGEPAKGGADPAALGAVLDEIRELDRIEAIGLMTIPAPGDPDGARAAFKRLRSLRDEHGLEHLSMGMSDDFEIAIEEGSTIVRVGSAIFGPRAK